VLSPSHGRTLDRCRGGEVAGKDILGTLFSVQIRDRPEGIRLRSLGFEIADRMIPVN
jgi:hypothetical protein